MSSIVYVGGEVSSQEENTEKVASYQEEVEQILIRSDIKEFLQEFLEEKADKSKAVILMWIDEEDDSRCGYVFPKGYREKIGLIHVCKDMIVEDDKRLALEDEEA